MGRIFTIICTSLLDPPLHRLHHRIRLDFVMILANENFVTRLRNQSDFAKCCGENITASNLCKHSTSVVDFTT